MGAGHACITPHVDKGKGAFCSTQPHAFFSITPTTPLLAPVLGFISVLRQPWIIVSRYLLRFSRLYITIIFHSYIPRSLRISVLKGGSRMAQPRLNSDGRAKLPKVHTSKTRSRNSGAASSLYSTTPSL